MTSGEVNLSARDVEQVIIAFGHFRADHFREEARKRANQEIADLEASGFDIFPQT